MQRSTYKAYQRVHLTKKKRKKKRENRDAELALAFRRQKLLIRHFLNVTETIASHLNNFFWISTLLIHHGYNQGLQ
jgi:hypothetical protein